MKIAFLIAIVAVVPLLILFGNANQKPDTKENAMMGKEVREILLRNRQKDTETIYLAGGCFWGVEGYFKRLDGVVDTQTGYANGASENPSYEEVIRNSGHAETVKVEFDPAVISLEELLLHFLRVIDPYSVNKQGNDRGIQYRSGIYFSDEEQALRVGRVIGMFEAAEGKKTAIEILPLEGFWDAEEYHQDYLEKNPYGYCHISLAMADDPLLTFPVTLDETEEQLKARIGEFAFNVARKGATERSFTSPLLEEHRRGIFVDVVSGQPLFSSNDKFDSGSGWPSFTRPIEASAITYFSDDSLGMSRIEVKSQLADTHLGHVFNDGPRDSGGLRYCINGAALAFIPYEQMEQRGYGAYMVLVN